MPYVEKRIYSGDILEVERYSVTKGGRPRGSRNAEQPGKDQAELNSVQSWRLLFRMLNCNFSRDAGDMCITLRFAEMVTRAEANREYAAFLRRVRNARQRMELEPLRYICVRESQSGREHAHVIVNAGIPFEMLSQMWKPGTLWCSRLDDTNNYKELARYLTNQHKPRKGSDSQENAKEPHRKHQRSWTCSRNLQKPIVKKRPCRPVTLNTMPRAPKGYELLPEYFRDADVFGNLFLKWTCRKLPEPNRNRKPGTLRGRMAC